MSHAVSSILPMMYMSILNEDYKVFDSFYLFFIKYILLRDR